MHTCFSSYIVYGFNEGTRDSILDRDFVDLHGLIVGALDIVRGYCGEACYGIPVDIDENGHLILDPRDKDKVNDFFENFMKFNQDKDYSFSEKPKLGFYTIITGDYQICATEYNLEK